MAAARLRDRLKSLVRACERDPRRAVLAAGVGLAMAGLALRALAGAPSTSALGRAGHADPGTSRNPATNGVFQTAAPSQSAAGDGLVEWLDAERHPPRRDLFAADALPGVDASVTAATGSQTVEKSRFDEGLWDEVAKSMAARADHSWERQTRLADLKREAGRLRLTKIVTGPPPAAFVNDELVEEGCVVASFRVLRIEPRRIIVEREGIRLDVPLN